MMTLNDLIYRLTRLRRLWVVGIALPGVAVLIAGLVSTGQTLLLYPPIFITCALLWAFSFTGLLLRFPRAGVELITLSLSVTIILATMPGFEALVAMKPDGFDPRAALGIGLLIFGFWFVLFLGMVALQPRLLTHKVGKLRRVRTVLRSPHSAEAVFRAAAPKPDHETPQHRHGPVQANGFFDVFLFDPLVAIGLGDDPDDPPRPLYRLHITETGHLWQNMLILNDWLGPPDDPTAWRIEVHPRKNGCVLISEELTDVLSPFLALQHWLEDAGRDHYTAIIDTNLGLPSPALRLLDYDSPLVWVARRMPVAGEPSL